MKKTKIICTIGPKTESKEMLALLLKFGMDIMRLNLSHGDHNEHLKRINNLRSIPYKKNRQAAILLDTKGPEIRTMSLEKEKILLKAGQIFILSTDKSIIGNNKIVSISYPNIINDLKIGSLILIDDGTISMKVIDICNKDIICKVLNSGLLGNNKGINTPGVSINIPTLDKKDKLDLIFGCKQKVDFIAASFIRKYEDVLEIRNYINKFGGKEIKIISKIENQEGLNNFNSILEISDGIMVARGDLGVEIPIEEVILAQKQIIKKCNQESKMVITATHMLESMIINHRPTRAEAGDIANAIIDGTDAVMLSAETANGKYPVQSVDIMSRICKKTDLIKKNKTNYNFYKKKVELNYIEVICKHIVEISETLKASLIIVKTKKGRLAKTIRKYFPSAIILALTNNIYTARQLILSKGIEAYFVEKIDDYDFDKFYKKVLKIILENKLAKIGELVMIMFINQQFLLNNNVNNTSIHIMSL